MNSQPDIGEPSTVSNDSSDVILSMLGMLSESNQPIIQRIEAIEQKQQSVTQELPHQPASSDI